MSLLLPITLLIISVVVNFILLFFISQMSIENSDLVSKLTEHESNKDLLFNKMREVADLTVGNENLQWERDHAIDLFKKQTKNIDELRSEFDQAKSEYSALIHDLKRIANGILSIKDEHFPEDEIEDLKQEAADQMTQYAKDKLEEKPMLCEGLYPEPKHHKQMDSLSRGMEMWQERIKGVRYEQSKIS